MFDNPPKAPYTPSQLEEVARLAAEKAVASLLHLDNKIEQGRRGEEMPSNYRETYYFTEKDGTITSTRISGFSKKDTDRKFMLFLQERMKSTAPLLKDFINNTYRKTFMRNLSPTTVANYNIYLDRYILPNLGEKHLDQISVQDIQNLYDWMANAKKHGCRMNLRADTIRRVSGFLSRVYRIAIEMNLVSDSPIKKTLLINEGKVSEHHKALPDKDVLRVKKELQNLEDEQQRLYMGLLVYTGMRREEIAGIGWEHIHLKERYGEVCRTVVYPDGKKTVIRNQTKTKKSTREFVIPEALASILEPCARDSGYIIHGKDPSQPAPISTLKRTYSKAFNALNIKGWDNHDWRATFGTQLKEAGMSSAQLADLMGHADTRMVETTYAPTRHEGIMKHKYAINSLNKWFHEETSEAL